MTAESLKAFISVPSSTDSFSTKKPSTHNFVKFGLTVSIIVTIVLLGFTIWNSNRIGKLQDEITSLNVIIQSMKEPEERPRLSDFEEPRFEKDEDKSNEPAYDSAEDEESRPLPDSLEEYDDDDIIDGSGLYSDDDEDNYHNVHTSLEPKEKEDIGHYYDPSFGDTSLESTEKEEIVNYYDPPLEGTSLKPKQKRVTRSVSGSSNGIPIYEDSYALKRNRTGGPDDERIEQHLLAHKSPTPTLRPRTSTTTEAMVVERRGRYMSAAGNMIRSQNTPKQKEHRRSRNRRLLRPLLKSGRHESLTALPYQHPIAVHYHLNNTISGKHILRPNHNKLPHDGDVYIGSPHPWARTLGMDKAFELNHGVLIVKEGGLYFVYAQIYYDNRYDRNGFVLYHNVQPFLQCAVFVPTNTIKSHTCYTSGVIYLESNDELHLRDIHQDRDVMLTNAKSFFGVIKLGGI